MRRTSATPDRAGCAGAGCCCAVDTESNVAQLATIAIASIWLTGPLHLGLGANHIVLLALTCIVTVLTVVPGRATLLQAGVHLALLAAYLFLAVSP